MAITLSSHRHGGGTAGAADPSNAQLENERSTQVPMGFAHHLNEDLRFTAEAYHQRLSNLLVFDDRTTVMDRADGSLTLDPHTKRGARFIVTFPPLSGV